MTLNPAQQILWDIEVLYKTTIELYEAYFTMLEVAIAKTPLSEVERLSELNALAKEGEEAFQADMAVFEKAVTTDTESFANMQDKLKIEDIYKKLQK